MKYEKILIGVIALAVIGYVVYYYYFSDSKKKALLTQVWNDYQREITYAANFYGIPTRRIASIICVESGGDYTAKGSLGEVGLMQIMPQSYENVFKPKYAQSFSFGLGSPFADNPLQSPDVNIAVGTGILKIYYDSTGSLDDATQMYNTGRVGSTAGLAYVEKVKQYERQWIL